MPARPSASAAPQRAGHTLWEVLLVLALLGAASAVVAPALTDRGRAALQRDAASRTTSDLLALLARARRSALERGTAVQVTLDPATGRYWIFSLAGGALRLVAESTLTLAPGAALETDAPRVHFRFAPTGAAAGTVTVRGADVARRVVVDPFTGLADADSSR